jgi:hypothetical protein
VEKESGDLSQTKPVSRSSTAAPPKFDNTMKRGQFALVVHVSV